MAWSEISYGKFSRSIRMENNLDVKKITAECKNGILRLSIPKLEEKDESTKIDIK